MSARLASLFAAAALCAAASPTLAQDWHQGPPLPPEAPGPDFRDGHGPMPHREMRRFELRHDDGRGDEGPWEEDRGPPPGPGMMMPPPPLPGGPGPMMTYVYPSPYPGWVYPPVAWVKVPIVREHARDCGCEEVVEEKVVVREASRPVHHRRAGGKWLRSTK